MKSLIRHARLVTATHHDILKVSCICLFLILHIPLHAEDKRKILITWEKISVAKSYKIEIKDEADTIVYTSITKETEIEVELLPGVYSKRLIVVDKLLEETELDWTPLRVILAVTPELTEPIEKYRMKQNETMSILLKGKNLISQTKIYLEWKGNQIPLKTEIQEESQSIKLTFSGKELTVEKYNLVLVNPVNKNFTVEDFLTVEPESENRIDKFAFVKKSLVLPGWGEYAYGKEYEDSFSTQRGYAYFSTFWVVAFHSIYTYHQYQAANDKFKSEAANSILLALSFTESSPVRQGIASIGFLNAQSSLHSLNTLTSTLNRDLEIMTLLYLVQLADSILLQRKANALSETTTGFQFKTQTRNYAQASQKETEYSISYSIFF